MRCSCLAGDACIRQSITRFEGWETAASSCLRHLLKGNKGLIEYPEYAALLREVGQVAVLELIGVEAKFFEVIVGEGFTTSLVENKNLRKLRECFRPGVATTCEIGLGVVGGDAPIIFADELNSVGVTVPGRTCHTELESISDDKRSDGEESRADPSSIPFPGAGVNILTAIDSSPRGCCRIHSRPEARDSLLAES